MKKTKKYFIVESRHNKDECLKALDEIMEKGDEVFNKFNWGCAMGDHVGWARIEADNIEEIKELIPEFIRKKTKIKQLKEFPESFQKAKNRGFNLKYISDDDFEFA